MTKPGSRQATYAGNRVATEQPCTEEGWRQHQRAAGTTGRLPADSGAREHLGVWSFPSSVQTVLQFWGLSITWVSKLLTTTHWHLKGHEGALKMDQDIRYFLCVLRVLWQVEWAYTVYAWAIYNQNLILVVFFFFFLYRNFKFKVKSHFFASRKGRVLETSSCMCCSNVLKLIQLIPLNISFIWLYA